MDKVFYDFEIVLAIGNQDAVEAFYRSNCIIKEVNSIVELLGCVTINFNVRLLF